MFQRIPGQLYIAAALGLVACVSFSSRIQAETPGPVLRTFAFVPLGIEYPNFASDDSLALTVLPAITQPASGSELRVLDENYNNPTLWRVHAVHYAARSNVRFTGLYYWKIDGETPDSPPVGAHSFTGPTGNIESIQVVKIRQCASYDCSSFGNTGAWTVDNSVNGTQTFVIVKAWFSK